MTIGERIKKIRTETGLSQKEVAKRLGVSQPSYAQYESGKRKPKYETLVKIAQALNADSSMFIPIETVMELPEFRTDIYGTDLRNILHSLEQDNCCISKQRSAPIVKSIKKCMKDALKLKSSEEIKTYYSDANIKYSQWVLHEFLDQYKEYDISDIWNLVNNYNSLTDSAQSKIDEYILDLLEIPVYRRKSDNHN